MATAVIGSQLSVRAQRRAREAEDRNQEMERIHALGRALLAHDTLSATGEAAVWQIVAALEASGAALYIAQLQRTHQAGTIPDIDSTLRQCFRDRRGVWYRQARLAFRVYPLYFRRSPDRRSGDPVRRNLGDRRAIDHQPDFGGPGARGRNRESGGGERHQPERRTAPRHGGRFCPQPENASDLDQSLHVGACCGARAA